MYEHQTYEVILSRMLDRVQGEIDKREGSIIYDALAPAAIELAQLYAMLDVLLKLLFANTSSGEYLELRTSEYGVERKLASFAIRKGVFKDSTGNPIDIPLDSRFSINNVSFRTSEKIQIGEYKLEAELPGKVGNKDFGALIPIDIVDTLATAELLEVLVPGVEEESDEELLARYKSRINSPSTSGNANHYKQWSLEIIGVTDAKVIPVWNGNGTVKVILLGDNKQSPEQTIIEEVYDYIETQRPIGAEVTVVGATEAPLDISATLTLASGKSISDAVQEVSVEVEKYLSSIAFVDPVVRYTQIGSILLNAPSVLDYSNLKINNSTSNIQVAEDGVAILGAVVFS